jgi:hypothetical protein
MRLLQRCVLLVSLSACGDMTKGSACIPGAQTACACSDGTQGAQVCNSDGTYSNCAGCSATVAECTGCSATDTESDLGLHSATDAGSTPTPLPAWRHALAVVSPTARASRQRNSRRRRAGSAVASARLVRTVKCATHSFTFVARPIRRRVTRRATAAVSLLSPAAHPRGPIHPRAPISAAIRARCA